MVTVTGGAVTVTTRCGGTGIGWFVDGDKQCYNASGYGSGPPHRASSTLRAPPPTPPWWTWVPDG